MKYITVFVLVLVSLSTPPANATVECPDTTFLAAGTTFAGGAPFVLTAIPLLIVEGGELDVSAGVFWADGFDLGASGEMQLVAHDAGDTLGYRMQWLAGHAPDFCGNFGQGSSVAMLNIRLSEDGDSRIDLGIGALFGLSSEGFTPLFGGAIDLTARLALGEDVALDLGLAYLPHADIKLDFLHWVRTTFAVRIITWDDVQPFIALRGGGRSEDDDDFVGYVSGEIGVGFVF